MKANDSYDFLELSLNIFPSDRDESIKKLLEMLQSKGLSSRATEEDHERTRRLADAEMTIHQLEGLLEQKDKEMLQLREVRRFIFVFNRTGKDETKRSQAFPCVWACAVVDGQM